MKKNLYFSKHKVLRNKVEIQLHAPTPLSAPAQSLVQLPHITTDMAQSNLDENTEQVNS
jgi:hypothetical protein